MVAARKVPRNRPNRPRLSNQDMRGGLGYKNSVFYKSKKMVDVFRQIVLVLHHVRTLGDIRRLESVAWMHQDQSWVQVLLCLSAGCDVWQRDFQQ